MTITNQVPARDGLANEPVIPTVCGALREVTEKTEEHLSFEFNPKDTSISLRLSSRLLQQIREAARERGISYQKYIRQSLEKACFRDRRLSAS